jgi:hypothetical protein
VHKSVRVVSLVCSLLSLSAWPARAQDKGREERAAPVVPTSAMPPAGLCRVWLRDVPAGQQPAPTDCASAIRKAPSSATVLFGDPKSEQAQKLQSRPGTPGAGAHSRGGVDRTVPAQGFAPGTRGGGSMRAVQRGAQSPGAPPSVSRPPASAPPTKPREKPLS